MNEILNWCQTNQGFCMVILTLVLALCAMLTCWFAHRSIAAMRVSDENKSRPYVILEIVPDVPFFDIRMVNVGKTAARNVVVSAVPKLELMYKNFKRRKISFLDPGVAYMPPQDEHKTGIGTFSDIEAQNPTLIFSGRISYQSDTGKLYSDAFTLDFNLYNGITYSGRKTIHDVGVQLEKIGRTIEHVANGFCKPHVISEDFNDYQKRQREWIESVHAEDAKQKSGEPKSEKM